MKIGLDIGSTTIKCVVLDENNQILHKSYQRHYSRIVEKAGDILNEIVLKFPQAKNAKIAISGSAGMGIAQSAGISFIQEVYATRVAAKKFIGDTDVIIELGGEDAKILFMSGSTEVRMNGSCAGGTGAFIDQMATLLGTPIDEINELSKNHEKVYTIASRCGVFAKTDIQPLLNQGAKKEDLAASIFYAVANQTIAGLAQGREISGKVVYLGGPLTFLSELRKCFDDTLKTKGIFPENSLYFVSLGAALCADKVLNIDCLIKDIANYKGSMDFASHEPLFKSQEEYEAFKSRHKKAKVKEGELQDYNKEVYIGIDAGSTTVKAVVMGEDNELLYQNYRQNNGNPIPIVKDFLNDIYSINPSINVKAAAATGYGEEMIKNAFNIDFGVVETIAHFTAAKEFLPDVEFVIDIGGQDIKCFKIHNKTVDNIFLNEACSSGCGSFLQTFANALGYSIEEFSKLGILAKHPVDLGSRCTVFMNSSVKQAQKDGATIEDISAGLSLSVVKNALYKVIRVSSPEELGRKIVVQGGTFLNDAVLRAFESELKTNVVRPNISGLMGAYGAALYAKEQSNENEKSSIITKEKLENFTHEIKAVNCNGCSNHCRLTINKFQEGRRYIGGNRCEKPITNSESDDSLNMYSFKLKELEKYKSVKGHRGVIGIPMALNMYELLPFWSTLFRELGFSIETSPFSNRELYIEGQNTIPSDTVCFPAKLVHGHIKYLLDKNVDVIFYPCMSYNFDEKLGDNHYNCPVVAYYPEVIGANVKEVKEPNFINDYVGIHRKKDFPYKFHEILLKYFNDITILDVKRAADLAYKEYENYINKVHDKGEEIIKKAREEGKHIIVLSGRPYHIDPEINHGIDKLITNFGVALISEDVVSRYVNKLSVAVLNQWTYHSRLYAAAEYVKSQKDMDLIQLVSFGCGVDAITTDEVRSILEKDGKIYTQIKIDEITNLGAVKIRIRSLLSAIEQQKREVKKHERIKV
mgnify:FL=1